MYEGANGIRARMLVTRLLDGPAAAFERLVAREAGAQDWPEIAACLERWRPARGQLAKSNEPTPGGEAFMALTALTLCRCAWARYAAAAAAHADPGRIERLARRSRSEAPIMAELYLSRIARSDSTGTHQPAASA